MSQSDEEDGWIIGSRERFLESLKVPTYALDAPMECKHCGEKNQPIKWDLRKFDKEPATVWAEYLCCGEIWESTFMALMKENS